MFSHLEETRARLESELGCDTFLKAYKTVQVETYCTCSECSVLCSRPIRRDIAFWGNVLQKPLVGMNAFLV